MRLMQFWTQAFNLRLACTASSRCMVGRENIPEILFCIHFFKKTKAIDPPSPLSSTIPVLGFFSDALFFQRGINCFESFYDMHLIRGLTPG